MKRRINVKINGINFTSEVEDRMLLVWFIRDVAGLTGTHVGCDTGQCGYCTPGLLMTSYFLLGRNDHPTEEEIMKAIHGNICRCEGYPGIIRAIKAASEKMITMGSVAEQSD